MRHCLEKSPEERFQSARDIAFDLEALSGVSTPVASTQTRRVGATRRRRLPLLLGAAVVVVGVAAGAYVAGKKAGQVAPATFRQLTFRRGLIGSARFAPDGQTILYRQAGTEGPWEIFQTRLDSPEWPAIRPRRSRSALDRSLRVRWRSRSTDTLRSHLREADVRPARHDGGGVTKEVLEESVLRTGAPTARAWPSSGISAERSASSSLPERSCTRQPAGSLIRASRPGATRLRSWIIPRRGDDGGSAGWWTARESAGCSRSSSRAPGALLVAGRQGSLVHRRVRRIQPGAIRRDAVGDVRVLAQGTGGLIVEDASKDGRALMAQDKARLGISALVPGAEKERDYSWLDWSLIRDISADGQTLLFGESGEGGGPGYSAYVRKADGSPAVRLGPGNAL